MITMSKDEKVDILQLFNVNNYSNLLNCSLFSKDKIKLSDMDFLKLYIEFAKYITEKNKIRLYQNNKDFVDLHNPKFIYDKDVNGNYISMKIQGIDNAGDTIIKEIDLTSNSNQDIYHYYQAYSNLGIINKLNEVKQSIISGASCCDKLWDVSFISSDVLVGNLPSGETAEVIIDYSSTNAVLKINSIIKKTISISNMEQIFNIHKILLAQYGVNKEKLTLTVEEYLDGINYLPFDIFEKHDYFDVQMFMWRDGRDIRFKDKFRFTFKNEGSNPINFSLKLFGENVI